MYLVGNMLFFWIFGDNFEDDMGYVFFMFFYLVGGFGVGFVQVFLEFMGMIFMVGVFGVIVVVMGGYFLFYLCVKVDILLILIIFFRIFMIFVWVMLGLWFVL